MTDDAYSLLLLSNFFSSFLESST